MTATIAVTHVSDPGCPWAWSAAQHHAVLHWRYGDQLAWRLALAVALFALLPLALELPSLATLALLAALLAGLVAFEALHFAEARNRLRQKLAHEH